MYLHKLHKIYIRYTMCIGETKLVTLYKVGPTFCSQSNTQKLNHAVEG